MGIIKIAVIGLGYVGLPLARLFATNYPVVGFDISQGRIAQLISGHESLKEPENDQTDVALLSCLPSAGENGVFYTADPEDLRSCNYYIVAVPTPVDKHHSPDLSPLYHASETVGKVLGKGDLVIYESTVCPGITEEECVPVLTKISGLVFNKDFFVGYSPERINPGDKEHTVENIIKITSGSTPKAAEKVDALYRSVIKPGTYPVSSIRVAEAAKVIENAQRDINIAFMNELSRIFHLLDIDTHEVLAAAGTKWNFLPFRPGLVGGHCIGVDPYYLIRKALDYGYHPGLILSGRRINDTMGDYIAGRVVKCMLKKNVPVKNAELLILGFTFKENCRDIRNTKVVDVVRVLQEYDLRVTICDPWATPKEVSDQYGLELINDLPDGKTFDVLVLAVAHQEFLTWNIPSLMNENHVIFDVKGCLNVDWVDDRL